MSRFFASLAHASLVEEAKVTVNHAIMAMNNGGSGEPTAEQIADFATAFTYALFRTGGPFKTMLIKGAKGPVDPAEIDFLILLANRRAGPLNYYRELLALDDISEQSMVVLSSDQIATLRKMSEVPPAAFVTSLMAQYSLSEVVSIAKMLFGDQV